MKSRIIVLAVGLIVMLASASATAQELPVPPAPEQPAQPGVEDVQKRADRMDPASWALSVSFGEGYESDVTYAGAESSGDWGRGVQGTLGKTWITRRGNMQVSGQGTQSSYQDASAMNRFTYGLNGSGAYALTRRLNWRLGGTFNEMYSQDSQLLTSAGIVFPRTITRTSGSFTELSYLMSPRNQITGSVATTRVGFVDSDLVPGTSMTARFLFSRQLNRSQSLGVSVGHTISTITGDIEGLLGRWQARMGVFTFNVAAGVRPYKLDGGSSGYSFAPGGSAGVTFVIDRRQSAGFVYEHAVEQAVGYGGTHLAHRYNGNYAFALGRRLTLDGALAIGMNSYPARPDYKNSGKTYMAGAHYLIVSGFSVGATYGLWISDATGFPRTTTYRVMLTAGYGLTWR